MIDWILFSLFVAMAGVILWFADLAPDGADEG